MKRTRFVFLCFSCLALALTVLILSGASLQAGGEPVPEGRGWSHKENVTACPYAAAYFQKVTAQLAPGKVYVMLGDGLKRDETTGFTFEPLYDEDCEYKIYTTVIREDVLYDFVVSQASSEAERRSYFEGVGLEVYRIDDKDPCEALRGQLGLRAKKPIARGNVLGSVYF